MTQSDISGEGLANCPFCGGAAELDYSRHFRAMGSGNMEKAVAIYCLECSADMTLCRSDHREYDAEQLGDILIENWNRRVPSVGSDTAGPTDHAGLVAALGRIATIAKDRSFSSSLRLEMIANRAAEAIAALSRAPEAVAFRWRYGPEFEWEYSGSINLAYAKEAGIEVEPVFAYPPAPQPAPALIETATASRTCCLSLAMPLRRAADEQQLD